MGDVAHELTTGIVVGLNVLRHLVEGAGQIHHFALTFHALNTDREVPAAKPLGASVIFWSGSVSFRIRKEVSTLAQSSMMQAEKKKFDQNSSLKSVSRAPEEQRKR